MGLRRSSTMEAWVALLFIVVSSEIGEFEFGDGEVTTVDDKGIWDSWALGLLLGCFSEIVVAFAWRRISPMVARR